MSKNTENYIWAVQHAYNLLRADHPGGALARLPAGGSECETLVQVATQILRDVLDDEDVPSVGTSVVKIDEALATH